MKADDIEAGITRKVEEIRQWIAYFGHDAIVCFMDDICACAAYLVEFERLAEAEVAE